MTSHLSYGQFGPAEYQLEEQEWIFPRNSDRDIVAPIQSDTGDWLKGCLDATEEDKPCTDPTAIIKRFPELQPASSTLLHDLATEAVHLQATDDSPNDRGDLLTLGKIAYNKADLTNDKGVHAIRVLAVPCGRNGEDLRVVRVESQRRHLGPHLKTYVDLPIPIHETGYWVGESEPIRQLLFSKPLGDLGALLAVRIRTKTLVFRPVWHVVRKPPVGAYVGCSYSPSYIEVVPVIAVTAAQTGGAPHASVCFDPNDQRRFAIVDALGRWTVLELRGRRYEGRVTSYRAQMIATGSAPSADLPLDLAEFDRVPADVHGPGKALSHWFRCVFYSSGLLVASRDKVHLTGSTGNEADLTQSVDRLQPGWANILDIANFPGRSNEVLILTSRRVLHIRLHSDARGIRTIASWPHYRDQDDIGLKLSCNLITQTELNVLVHSCRAAVCTSFTKSLIRPEDFEAMNDPVQIKVPLGITMLQVQKHIINGPLNTGGSELLTSLLMLGKDLSIKVQYYATSAPSTLHQVSSLRLKKPGSKVLRQFLSDAVVPEDDFIVTESADGVFAPDPHAEDVRLVPGVSWPSTSGTPWLADQPPSLDHHRVISLLIRSSMQTRLSSSKREHSQDGIRQHLLHAIHSADEENAKPFGTLLDIVEPWIKIHDIERFSTELADLAELKSLIKLNPSIIRLSPSGGGSSSAMQVYDNIAETWISRLTQYAPVQYRMGSSRHASEIAGEVSLASMLVQQQHEVPAMADEPLSSSKGKEREGSEKNNEQSHVPSLWIQNTRLSADPSQREADSQYQTSDHDSSYPNTPPTASGFTQGSTNMPMTPEPTQSTISSSSFSTIGGSNAGDMAYERLRRLVVFSSQPALLQPRLGRVLDHWDTQEDPDNYDWTQTRRNLEAKGERTLNRKVEKRARRHLERQRREAERAANELVRRPAASQPTPQLLPIRNSPPRPPAVQSTTPATSTGLGFSESQARPAMMVASQVSRGRHGGRPQQPPPKRRRAGF